MLLDLLLDCSGSTPACDVLLHICNGLALYQRNCAFGGVVGGLATQIPKPPHEILYIFQNLA
jgi:hypothetical protein